MAHRWILRVVVQGDVFVNATLGKSLERMTRRKVCRRKFEVATSDYEQVSRSDDPIAGLNLLEKLRMKMLPCDGLRP